MLTQAHQSRRVRPIANIFRWLRGVEVNYHGRAKLRHLDPHLRRDLGLTDEQIERELRRSVWDVPEWWR